ncbi:TraR/DksA C4-type zinc finger protein [Paenibacillus paeoniae]|uniref:Molecular chaperone DnaK n=1 Tax=Paenibacillus paeoniae TaxID=2292705 RepID=A0A371PPS1_9BACL|nr:TraR/DksA C4-type zinc finger protein [Paenibacillus paeoniae]REK77837.1 molecular chaperone DnaK [Paenibacillus paeoniae]
MSYPSSPQLALLRMRLQDEHRDIESRLIQNQHYGKEDSLRDESGELSPIDNHPADLATELYEREKDISLLEQEELHLRRIEAALDAMDKGSYGVCVVCGEPIPFERLDAVPDTLYCVSHAPRDIVSDSRPVEEIFLQPPFGRTSMDEHEDGYNGFDGEDAWQIVESWGNSDSPAMSENRNATDYEHIGIESQENDGYVEPLESFLATDITGRYVTVVRNREYEHYMQSNEGDHMLENEEDEPGF